MSKTLGELLDEYTAQLLETGQRISSVYLYMENNQTPKLVLCTVGFDDEGDYTEVLYEAIDIKYQIEEAQEELRVWQDKIDKLKKTEQDIWKAINLLKNSL